MRQIWSFVVLVYFIFALPFIVEQARFLVYETSLVGDTYTCVTDTGSKYIAKSVVCYCFCGYSGSRTNDFHLEENDWFVYLCSPNLLHVVHNFDVCSTEQVK